VFVVRIIARMAINLIFFMRNKRAEAATLLVSVRMCRTAEQSMQQECCHRDVRYYRSHEFAQLNQL